MIKVSNKRIINKLAIKSFKASKNRNIIAIIAIVLTTILFTSLFTLGIGMIESFQSQTIRQSGGDGHGVLKYITDEQYNDMKDHPLIDKISYNQIIADSVDNPEFLKRRVEMYYMDEIATRLGFCYPTTGTLPLKENEILTDTKTLDLLGVPHEVGSTVSLTYTMKGIEKKTDFILSGYWESDPAFNVGFAIVSKAFTAANADALKYTYNTDFNTTGSINSYIMFKNSFNLSVKLEKVIIESGYTVSDNDKNTPPLSTDIECNVNWAYLSSGFSAEPSTIIGLLLSLSLIIFTGYLIIYNIFQISIIKDIRFYGLLKTIGTTPKQIRKIILNQALLLSLIGIPLGLIIGFVLGKGILPIIMAQTSFIGMRARVSINPVIFIGSTLFAIFTVFISVRKPGKIAGKVSPVDAVRYSENKDASKKSKKKTTDGGKLWKMALSNLDRNRKRTIVTIISLTLSLVLLNSVFTISKGFDMDKYLSRFVDTDFLIGHANYFNIDFHTPEDSLSESFISAIETIDGFQHGGRLYKNIYVGTCSIYRKNPDEPNYYFTNKAKDGMPMLDLYGLEDIPLSRLDIVEGTLDIEKFKTGKYIIEGLGSDDHGNVYLEQSHYKIGDKVKISVDGKTYEYELLAKTRVKHYTNTSRSASNYIMYLPAVEYLEVVSIPTLMSYAFNVEDGKEVTMEAFIKSYTDTIEPLMNYESKQVHVDNFKDMQSTLITIGGILCIIIGFIGILNFLNSMLTSILSRQREFAILQGIGMTKKQLMKMLIFEGLYYALATIVLSFLLSTLFSFGIVGGIVSNLWFFSYKFIILPLILTYPILILISVVIPYWAYIRVSKMSIVERLREVD